MVNICSTSSTNGCSNRYECYQDWNSGFADFVEPKVFGDSHSLVSAGFRTVFWYFLEWPISFTRRQAITRRSLSTT